MVGFTAVLAHQGGWDEILFVAAPVVILVVLLRIANARAAHLEQDPPDTGDRGLRPSGEGPHPGADLPDPPTGPGGAESGQR
jgi:hypothetical protein